jgi:hypothetical protein
MHNRKGAGSSDHRAITVIAVMDTVPTADITAATTGHIAVTTMVGITGLTVPTVVTIADTAVPIIGHIGDIGEMPVHRPIHFVHAPPR